MRSCRPKAAGEDEAESTEVMEGVEVACYLVRWLREREQMARITFCGARVWSVLVDFLRVRRGVSST